MRSAPRRARRAAAAISYGEFVDDALFHPAWGYYSTGGVRFGEGGHYDTYPLALSPYFGRMVAGLAFRAWSRLGRPGRFELCELGAGNGQLCLDTLLRIDARAARSAAWRPFAAATRYRIVERSRALAARQRQQLGPLAQRVTWVDADLAQHPPRRPFGPAGILVANEVLDCLPHEQVLAGADGTPQLGAVIASLGGRSLTRAALARAMASAAQRRRVRWRDTAMPLAARPALAAFVGRYYPELLDRRRGAPPVFVAPRVPTLLASTARCYARAEALWIDYGDWRPFHLRAPAARKAFAGPPRSAHGLFDAPGEDDITFMVDFTLAADAAVAAGWRVVASGPQAELARLGGVRLDDAAETIIRQRALTWMLALAGVGPERDWRRGAIGWARHAAPSGTVPLRRYVDRSLREFARRRGATFKLLLLRR